MANSKISALTSATTPLAGTETLPVVQSSTTKQVSVANLTVGRSPTMNYAITQNGVIFQNSGVSRWILEREAGASDNLYLYRYNDAGSYAGNPFRISRSNGVMTWENGLAQGTANTGVSFSANTPAAGMTSQLLNWYEEGTFTPTIGGDSVAGTQTYSVQVGRYTRIGNRVNFNLRIVLSAKDALTAGNLIISGLPFASNSTAHTFNSFAVGNAGLFTLSASYTQLEAHIEPNLSYFYLGQIGSGQAYSYLQASAFAATSRIAVTGTYLI